MYIISECLIGHKVRYDGKGNGMDWVKDFARSHSVFLCCPEMIGGLPCPRCPSERQGQRVINTKGEDVTKALEEGANKALLQAREEAALRGEIIEGAILKSKSPSCGKDRIYDGTFSKVLISGEGVFAQRLREANIEVITEKEKIDD